MSVLAWDMRLRTKLTRRRAVVGLAAGLAGVRMAPALAGGPVALNLVLALDASRSVGRSDFAFQTSGLAAAFRDPGVIRAIEGLGPGGMSVCAFQFPGLERNLLSVDWALVRDADAARALADRFEVMQRAPRRGVTSIGNALRFGLQLLRDAPRTGLRNVIDVSGDGRSTVGLSVTEMRDRAVRSGVTINGLAITNEDRHLVAYYRDHVAGGPGAFVIDARSYADFAEAIRRKLLREIAGGAVV